jgi:hypothetical protein
MENLDGVCRPETILATNTSSISVTRIASTSNFTGRVIGMHFFNPAPIMQLGSGTSCRFRRGKARSPPEDIWECLQQMESRPLIEASPPYGAQ